MPRTEVRRHDDDRVLEIHGAALRIRDAPVVEYLQQDVEDIRMRLLDFVKEDHRIRLPPHRFGQLPAFVVADVAGRRADQPGNAVLLHVFRHVDAHHRRLGVEQRLGERLREFGLAHSRRPQK